MHRQLRTLVGLALAALLSATPSLALAHGEGPQQTVDGYTVTLMPPEKGFFTGRNPVAVSLWDWQGDTPEATLSVQLLAFAPAAGGHGDTHAEAAPADAHAATGDHATADDHATAEDHGEATAPDGHATAEDHAATESEHAHEATADDHAATGSEHAHEATADDHVATESEHAHDGAGAAEGQGLVAAPVALATSEELGEYRGELAFDEAGTYTVSVVFTVDGEEHGAIFDVEVAQSRPRGLVLGGFALVNALAIGSAAFLKWRSPAKPARKLARPAPAAPSAEEPSK